MNKPLTKEDIVDFFIDENMTPIYVNLESLRSAVAGLKEELEEESKRPRQITVTPGGADYEYGAKIAFKISIDIINLWLGAVEEEEKNGR